MVVNNGFEKLNPDEIVELVAEDYIAKSDPMDMNMENQTPFNPKPNIEVSLEEYEEWCRTWKFSLIVKPLGKLVNLQAIDRWVQRRWAKKGFIRVMDLVGNFFLVSFGSQEDYGHALFEGPWMIADHYLLVQRWRPPSLCQWRHKYRKLLCGYEFLIYQQSCTTNISSGRLENLWVQCLKLTN
ncbi:hypothetical protein Ahy_B01g053066 isoform C [Arachis hypogaea]|nr:hypothetical protein Ahy_B01g053066 isoform C [Arachis hypogaea]